jgi:hypothetical protein
MSSKKGRQMDNLLHEMEEQPTPVITTPARTEINNLLAQIEKLNRIIKLYEDDATFNGYYALNRLYNDQIEYLKSIEISELIAGEGKEYERAMKISDTLYDRMSDLNKLKQELNPSGDEEADVKGKVARRQIISPESMSNVFTNTAGKNS